MIRFVMTAWAAVNVVLFWPNPWMVAANALAVGILAALPEEATR